MTEKLDPFLAAWAQRPLIPQAEKLSKLSMAEQLLALEAKLVPAGFPATSPWWHETLKRFYDSKRRQLVVRAGRRGGKSSTLCRVAVLEALYGDYKITPGDTGIVGILSVVGREAQDRLQMIQKILDVLGVKYRAIKDTIYLLHRPIRFQVFTASFKSVVGGTWICAICDEVARWRDETTGANPAFEVLASLRPTMATMPNAKIYLSSSPLGMVDAHAKAFDEGDNDYQMIAMAPTWIANPSITEEESHKLEKNERVWKREYAATPQGALTSVFELSDIDRCIDLWEDLKIEAAGRCIMCIDPSRGHDAWTYCIAHWVWFDKRARLRIVEIGQVEDASDTRKSVDWLTNKAKANGCTQIASDQYDASGLAVLFSERNMSFYQNIWNAKTKKRAIDRLDRLMRDEDIALPDHEMMRRHLVEYSEKISRSGGDPTYSGRGKHDDYAAVILTLIMMDLDGKTPTVTAPLEPLTATKQIEHNWFDTLERRHVQRKEQDRDWGAQDWETYFDNQRYLP